MEIYILQCLSVKQVKFILFVQRLLEPKNQNNGLRPCESSDIINNQNWLLKFFHFWTCNWLLASWWFHMAGKHPWTWQNCWSRELKLWHLTMRLHLQVPASTFQNYVAATFSLLFCSWPLATDTSISFLEAQKTQYMNFLSKSVAGGAVTSPTATAAQPSFLRTVYQPAESSKAHFWKYIYQVVSEGWESPFSASMTKRQSTEWSLTLIGAGQAVA